MTLKHFRNRWSIDSSNRHIQTTLDTGESSYRTFDGQGLVSSETDYNGNTTFYTYDEQGHIIQVTYPDQSNVKYYWCCCEICKYVDATGTSNLVYDAVHRLSSIVYSTGKTVAYEYNGTGMATKITDPDGNNITYAYNTGGLCTSMTTSADSQTTTITYDALRRRSTVTYPTTANVVTTYTYDNANRITSISSVAGATTYSIDYSYVTNKDILSQQVIKLNAATISTIDLTYDSTGRVTEEKVTKPGPVTSYQKQYTWDKVSRRLSVKDVTNGNWLETSTFDTSGRLTRIVITAGTGSNPFSWPKGTTNVTCDANGNITQLMGRNVDTGAIWKVAHTMDYEQRVVKILLNNGDTVDNVYDGMGYRLKETTTSGGTPTPKNFVPIQGNRVIQERDGSDTITARYYWDGGRMFKKDHSTSTKYFVPEIANSPFTGWNNAGTFSRYDLWDTFGVLEDQSAAGSLSPFQQFANMLVDSSHLTTTPRNLSSYPEMGRPVNGRFRLKYQASPGGGSPGGCPDCLELALVVSGPVRVTPSPTFVPPADPLSQRDCDSTFRREACLACCHENNENSKNWCYIHAQGYLGQCFWMADEDEFWCEKNCENKPTSGSGTGTGDGTGVNRTRNCLNFCSDISGCSWYLCMYGCTKNENYRVSANACLSLGLVMEEIRKCLVSCQKGKSGFPPCDPGTYNICRCGCACHGYCFMLYQFNGPLAQQILAYWCSQCK